MDELDSKKGEAISKLKKLARKYDVDEDTLQRHIDEIESGDISGEPIHKKEKKEEPEEEEEGEEKELEEKDKEWKKALKKLEKIVGEENVAKDRGGKEGERWSDARERNYTMGDVKRVKQLKKNITDTFSIFIEAHNNYVLHPDIWISETKNRWEIYGNALSETQSDLGLLPKGSKSITRKTWKGALSKVDDLTDKLDEYYSTGADKWEVQRNIKKYKSFKKGEKGTEFYEYVKVQPKKYSRKRLYWRIEHIIQTKTLKDIKVFTSDTATLRNKIRDIDREIPVDEVEFDDILYGETANKNFMVGNYDKDLISYHSGDFSVFVTLQGSKRYRVEAERNSKKISDIETKKFDKDKLLKNRKEAIDYAKKVMSKINKKYIEPPKEKEKKKKKKEEKKRQKIKKKWDNRDIVKRFKKIFNAKGGEHMGIYSYMSEDDVILLVPEANKQETTLESYPKTYVDYLVPSSTSGLYGNYRGTKVRVPDEHLQKLKRIEKDGYKIYITSKQYPVKIEPKDKNKNYYYILAPRVTEETFEQGNKIEIQKKYLKNIGVNKRDIDEYYEVLNRASEKRKIKLLDNINDHTRVTVVPRIGRDISGYEETLKKMDWRGLEPFMRAWDEGWTFRYSNGILSANDRDRTIAFVEKVKKKKIKPLLDAYDIEGEAFTNLYNTIQNRGKEIREIRTDDKLTKSNISNNTVKFVIYGDGKEGEVLLSGDFVYEMVKKYYKTYRGNKIKKLNMYYIKPTEDKELGRIAFERGNTYCVIAPRESPRGEVKAEIETYLKT
ncbi:hypothetical protein AKJ56_00400 [candidate division MSBL1 archaeon SCGC-AAA382N08]|uniref:Uncharacterized protein n=1 Tax=candidate division MSBL1 archaeon SCGC-AAA382N08 TaxID=1698285 RepID=A0A133VQS2_9EURY|nr:hypothetical protein AKJ56_00400 [candidate division MSBL1 archaeon SCGC-AAA382N08]